MLLTTLFKIVSVLLCLFISTSTSFLLTSLQPISSTILRAHDTNKSIILPIFPLRKRVKFPTETLKLTLWEDRYKDMSRYVLDHHSTLQSDVGMPIFGALYCSHKTQIVKGGIKPITPLVEAGDVGIICGVTSSQVFINGEEVDLELKYEASVEKIRLWAHGLTRFRVERILSDGLEEGNGDGKTDCLPFILVEASRLDDDFLSGESVDIDGRLQDLLRRQDDLIFDATSLMAEKYKYTFQEGNEHRQKQQMISLALTSQLEAIASADEMLNMLGSTSIIERLEYLERKLPKSKKRLGDIIRHMFE
jgi:hypothetical protein